MQIEESGIYTLELRSHRFDAYLVLRAESGTVLAEDDDGLLATHSRIVRALEPGRYRVSACALRGERGGLVLGLRAGPPPELSATERAHAETADEAERMRVLEEELGADHPGLATALLDLAGLRFLRGELDAAVPLLERAVAIREKVLGARDPELAYVLNDLAVVYFKLGDHAAARPLYERALAIREQVLGPEHPDTAASQNDFARLLQAQGDPAAARPLYERALATRERALGPEAPLTLSTLNNLATLLDDMGEYSAARKAHERVLATRERVLGPDHPLTATSLNNLAFLLERYGEHSAARPLYERSLAIHTRVYGEQHPATATSLCNLAGALQTCGDYSQARALHERALAIREAVLGPLNAETAASLDSLGQLLQRQGDLAAAQDVAERALAVREQLFEPEHPELAMSQVSLASVLEARGDFARARALLVGARATFEEHYGPMHPEVADVLILLAQVLEAEGDGQQALALFERVLEIRERAFGPERSATALSLANLGTAARTRGDSARARSCYERALAVWEREFGPDHPLAAGVHYNLGVVCADQGDQEEAYEHARKALSSSLAHAKSVLWTLSEHESVLFLKQGEDHLNLLASLAARAPSALMAAAYELSLAWRGIVSRTLLARRHDGSPELQAKTADLRGMQAELSKLLYGPKGAEHAAVGQRIRALRARRNELEVELGRLFGPRDEPAPTLAELRAHLPPGAAWLDFLVQPVYAPGGTDPCGEPYAGKWSEPRLCAWILRPEHELERVDLGPAAEIEAQTRAWLRAVVGDAMILAQRGIRATSDAAGRGDDGRRLTALLWEPLARLLQKSELVFVRADSFLGTLPLEVLPLEGGRYLVEEMRFVYTSTPLDWLRPPPLAALAPPKLLVAGDVDFQRRAGLAQPLGAPAAEPAAKDDEWRRALAQPWRPLPATADEARALLVLFQATFPGGEALLLTGEGATEERMKAELVQPRFAHLATHGFFHPEGTTSLWDGFGETPALGGVVEGESERRSLIGQLPGLLTGLVCAGASEPAPAGRDDGLLTAEEVLWLDLSKVELVVLSACETALGEPRSGEGMIGLRRAFGLAGAKTVVSSLWSVKDRSTSELMQRFYENLWRQGQGRVDALRNAQLELLAKNRAAEGNALPSTWGAFVLSGEWR